MKSLNKKKIEEVCSECGIDQEVVIYFIQQEWILPADVEELIFDEEDIARISLIRELQQNLGVNDEAVPIILNLIDQLHYIRSLYKHHSNP